MGYKHTYDTIYTHFQGITNNIYGFGRPFFAPSFFYPSTHISAHPFSSVLMTGFYIKLCSPRFFGHTCPVTMSDRRFYCNTVSSLKLFLMTHILCIIMAALNLCIAVHDAHLQVGWVPVAFIRSGLQLLIDPAFQFVSISLEVHEEPGILKPTASLAGRILEVGVTIKDLFTTTLDVFWCLQDLDLTWLCIQVHLCFLVSKQQNSE